MSTRENLATAASTVDGIQVTPYFNQSTKLGTGMVRLDHTDYPDKLGGVVTWQVLIVLTTDVAAAEKYLEEKIPELLEALKPNMTITTVTPQELVIDTGRLPVVVIQGTREEE